jgi:hypothetical protein
LLARNSAFASFSAVTPRRILSSRSLELMKYVARPIQTEVASTTSPKRRGNLVLNFINADYLTGC